MKLPIIITAGMLTAAIAYNAYALTCGAQPSCDSLGYKYTGATTDCVNTPLKCPFNSSYFNCVKKADIFNNSVPDLSKGKTLSLGVVHTITEDGWLQAGSAKHKEGVNNKPLWYINDQLVGTIIGKDDENTAFYPVIKGDRVMHNGKAEYNYFTFYPNRKTNSN